MWVIHLSDLEESFRVVRQGVMTPVFQSMLYSRYTKNPIAASLGHNGALAHETHLTLK